MNIDRHRIRGGLTTSLILGASIAVNVASAEAGGFYAPYQSGQAIGSALAGSSARSDDASFFFFNPASIAGLAGADVTIDARLYVPSFEISARRATSPLGADLTADGGSGELTDPVAGPGFFAALPLSPGLWLGFGGSAPFAVDIKADPGWAGRFQLLDTDMRGTNLSIALAYQVTDWLVLAAGIQHQQFKAEFAKSELIPTLFGPIEARGFLKGEDWATGAIAGVLVTPVDGTRIGIGYRSQLTHTMQGTAGADLPGIPVDSASFDVDLPQVVSVGLEQRLGPQLRLFADVQWVDWSRFKGFDISFGSGRPNELRLQAWDDTWAAAIGFGYAVSPSTEITAGVHYDTAVTGGGANTLSPDAARTMLAFGLNHKIEGRGVVSAHYAHVFFEDARIDVSGPTSGTLEGTFSGGLDIFGVSFRLDL